MKLLILSLFSVLSGLLAFGQDPTVTLKATVGQASKSAPVIIRPRSAVTYNLSSTTSDASGAAIVTMSIVLSRVQPSGLQFDLKYSTSDISSITVTPGASTTSAGKSLNCAVVTPGTTRCLISGTNQTTIPAGVVASISAQISPTTTATTTSITMTGLISSSLFATTLTSTIGTPGVITIPTSLASLTCDKSEIETGESMVCTVTLIRSSTSPVTASLSVDDATKINIPVSIAVPASQTTAMFTATAK